MTETPHRSRWPFLLPLVVIVLLGVVFGKRLLDVAGGVDPKSLPTVLLNTPAPTLDLPALPGHGAVTSADLKGRVTLVNFFGSWCATCVTEHPVLMDISKSGAVDLIGVAWRDQPENTLKWLAKYGDPFQKIGQDPKSVAAIDFGVVAAPESFLIDANGVIRYKQSGAITAEDWKTKILPLIAQLEIMKALIPFAAMLLIASGAAAVQPKEMLKDPALEARAREIGQDLACVVCQGETIDESGAEIAGDMRVLVRQRITAGESNDQIIAYMVSRYGDYVRLKPRFIPRTYLLWLGPFAILIVGGITVARRLRRALPGTAPLTPEETAALTALETRPGAARMIWLLFALMTLAVIVALLWPLLRRSAPQVTRADYDMSVFRDQLDEVERDIGRGVLTAAEAEAARIEIKRRMLAASKRTAETVRAETPRAHALLTTSLAVAVPLAALGLYLLVGTPQMPASSPAIASQHDAEMAGLIDKLAARMKAQPDDPQGWALLARSYRQMQRYADAAEAYRNIVRLIPDDADGFAGYGEMVTAAASGTVSAEAHEAFVHALELDHDEPRSQFYLGLERAQAGDNQGAIAIWRALTAAAPADASWVPTVRGQMAELAQSANIPPMGVTPRYALDVVNGTTTPSRTPAPAPQAASADPTAPNMGALQGQYSPENIAMIQGMVGGLAAKLDANPDDFNGWMLLGRSYTVIKNLDGAKQAYVHAIKLKPADDAPKAQLNALVLNDGTAPSPALVKLAADLQREPLALYIVGQGKAAAGDGAAAKKLWQDASAQLPATAPLKAEIARQMAALK